MKYVKDIGKYQKIKEGYTQKFIRGFNRSLISQPIIEYVSKGKIDEVDKEILRHVIRFRFLTPDQISRIINLDFQETRKRLRYMIKNNILNCFKLVDTDDIEATTEYSDEIFEDALVFICLDYGGKIILSLFDKINVEEFSIDMNVTSSYHIGRTYFAAEAFLKINATCPQRVLNIGMSKIRNVKGKIIIKPLMEITLSSMTSSQYNFYLFDLVRKEDVLDVFQDAAEKYRTILTTKAWKKYYDINNADKKPMLLIVCDEEETVQKAISIMQGFGYGLIYRFILEDQFLEMDLVNDAFIIKHDFKTGEISQMKTTIFDPNK